MNKPTRGDPPPSMTDDQSAWGEMVERAAREAEGGQTVGAIDGRPAQRRPASWWLHGLAGAGLMVAGILAWQQFYGATGPSAAELDQGRRALLALVDDSLAEHVRLRGGYPESLDEVLPLRMDVQYRRTVDGYEIRLTLSDGRQLVRKSP